MSTESLAAHGSGMAVRAAAIHAGYGSSKVLSGVELHVGAGESVALLGPNGAGKTTMVRALLGLIPCKAGKIEVDGQPVGRWSPERAAAAGIAIVPEGRRIFPRQTVSENLELGAWVRRVPKEQLAREVQEMLDRFPMIARRRDQPAAALSGGEAQLLAVGMALMAKPRLVILDEPSLGLAPLIVDAVMQEVRALKDQGVSTLLVEQNVRKALAVVDRGYVLNQGRIQLEADAEQLRSSGDLGSSYFGTA